MVYEYQQYLAHHGVKGQKWGQRKYQNEDGTLTEEGKRRYGRYTKAIQDLDSLINSKDPNIQKLFPGDERNKLIEQRDKMIQKARAKEMKKKASASDFIKKEELKRLNYREINKDTVSKGTNFIRKIAH